jgi:hypothetical protein
MDKEYDVYYHRLAGAMSDELNSEEETTEESIAPPEETKEEMPTAIQLDGYETVFDQKVALTPVDLIPLIV